MVVSASEAVGALEGVVVQVFEKEMPLSLRQGFFSKSLHSIINIFRNQYLINLTQK